MMVGVSICATACHSCRQLVLFVFNFANDSESYLYQPYVVLQTSPVAYRPRVLAVLLGSGS